MLVSVIGVVGIYVGNTFSEAKGRPLYLVENEIRDKVDELADK